ncbi:mitochondrial peptide methionine sulfoxide reductase isoform X3 [Neolamprologus brichardi]|uniref:mitochondrial peptide methionine sulfoxide reductase isoform X3 n=1 Tax=Neolamprologus brichardi TaxID=32507 RepID=UPI0003EC60DC|nr:mitochondrial peptide methionine sulfoxide reductase isoform X3 [Neolamprologus brichardi]
MCKRSTCDFNAKKVVYKAFVFLGALNSICELDKAGYWTSETLVVARGRPSVRSTREKHDVNGNRTVPPFPEGTEMAMFGMGCFWGAERKFWRQKGVYSTQVGYSGGYTSNPTYKEVCTGMRQGNDIGTTYRSAIYTYTKQQLEEALASKEQYQKVLTQAGHDSITTEIAEAKQFYYAEEYHQQYLSKNPDGYCGLGGTGVACPIEIKSKA